MLRDAAQQKADRLVVLGDTVNYGAQPVACFERLCTEADILLLGNHERAMLVEGGEAGMGGAAGAGVAWTRAVLAQSAVWTAWTADKCFPDAAQARVDGVQLVHGSPRDPVVEYVWPGHASYFLAFNEPLDRRLASLLGARDATHTFCGHTHVPAILLENGPAAQRLLHRCPENPRLTFVGPATRFSVPAANDALLEGMADVGALINPGSVGQPRDGNPAASYVLYTGETLRFRRVPYDIPAAQARIRALPILPSARNYLADRLALGE